MKLQFLGADRQVTGSRHLLEASGTKVLIDYGMFQEREFLDRNWEPGPVPPRDLDALVVTHAHIDHCGLLPRYVHEGFRGPIYCTPASAELLDLVLRDSAQIQAEDVEFKKKRHGKEGRTVGRPVVPLYTEKDVDRTVPLVQPVPYGQPVRIGKAIEATFHDAGHILGSSIVEFAVRDGDGPRRAIFSGDLGQWDKPILRDPTVFEQADLIVMESTYGDRDHPPHEDIETQLETAINQTHRAGGNLVVPTFAIERAQEIMYCISRLTEAGRIPRQPVYLDSPMAVAATKIFDRHRECYDEEMCRLIATGHEPLRFPGLKLVRTVDESKRINDLREPAIIMAPSGMCTAGRIKHHLAHNIQRPECTVLFTGYQVQGTLGRQILQGNPEVRIHGRMWRVKARVAEIYGFSGHADRAALLRWLGSFRSPPCQLFLVHGEEQASLQFAEQIRSQMHWTVTVPEYRQSVTVEC